MTNESVKIHPKKLEALFNKVVDLGTLAEEFGANDQSPRYRLSTDQASWSFSGEAIQKYDDFVLSLLDKEWGEKYSQKHTELLVRQWIGLHLSDAEQSTVKKDIEKDLIEYANYNNFQEVYVPISGIAIESNELVLGQLILRKATNELAETLTERMSKIVDQGLDTVETKDLFKVRLSQTIRKLIQRSDFFLIPSVNAEPEKAEAVAIDQANQLLSFIHASLPLLSGNYPRIKISLLEDAVRPTREILIVQADSTSINFKNSAQFEQTKLVLTSQNLDYVREFGILFPLESSASASALSEVEEKLIEAVSWMSNAVTQRENRSRILSLTTILELFFGPPKDSGLSISAGVAEGIAMLSKDVKEDRLQVRDRIKKLYDKRSSVTHGNKVIIYDLDVAEAMQYAFWTLKYIYENREELKTTRDISRRIETLKFG